MKTRLEQKFEELKKENKKGLVVYLMAGVPSIEETVEVITTLEKAGADIIELGIPFSDPLADGPVIQKAGKMAIDNGMTLPKMLTLVKDLRKVSQIPVIGMGYINAVFHYGPEKFVKDFKAAGMDGVILPDVPHEESEELREICQKENFHCVEFVTIGTTKARMLETCQSASGFIYAMAVNGVTGVRKLDYTPIGRVCDMVHQETNVPVAVGFGIGTPEAAVAASKHADAVIVGSAVVNDLLDGNLEKAKNFVAELRHALDNQNN